MELSSDLYERILLRPAIAQGANRLYIVSGYATSAMADKHLSDLKQRGLGVDIQLIVGMSRLGGMAEGNHKGFVSLMADMYGSSRFKCNYVSCGPAVHAKAYAWFRSNVPVAGFVGSANYTQKAFSAGQIEAAVPYDANEIRGFHQTTFLRTYLCTNSEVADLVHPESAESLRGKGADGIFANDELKLCVSLLDSHGEVPVRSGLNWGQRAGREKNQAYIHLPMRGDLKKQVENFFPARGNHFTIQTDDRQIFLAARLQDKGKAIHTTTNNSLLGIYFRQRMGVQLKTLITKEHLLRYGRTDVEFYKIDDENYFMDFSCFPS